MTKNDFSSLDENNNGLLKTARKIRIQRELNARVRVLIIAVVRDVLKTLPPGVVSISFFGRTRVKPVIEVRHCMWKILLKSNYTSMDIARTFNVDHSSVIRATQRMEKFIERTSPKDPKLLRYAKIIACLVEVNRDYTDKLITQNIK